MTENLACLATASRTGHTILLHGGNAAGKTSLVLELARLAQRKITLFPMNQDTTTSDLLGSWTVTNEALLKQKVVSTLKEIFEKLVTLSFSVAKESKVFDDLATHYLNHKSLYMNKSTDLTFENLKEVCSEISAMMQPHEQDTHGECVKHLRQLRIDLAHVDEWIGMRKDTSSEIDFFYIEGPLVEAIRKGDWVLLDNIDQASGDVLERLNSVAEAEPQIALIESGTDEVLTRENGGIHPEFRLFATVNTDRSKAATLSSAFRNRCINIHLKGIDTFDVVIDKANLHSIYGTDAHDLLASQLQEIQGGEHIVRILVNLHHRMKEKCQQKQIQLVKNYKFTYRSLMTAANIVIHHIKHEHSDPIMALSAAVFRCYLDPIVSGRSEMFKIYQSVLESEIETFGGYSKVSSNQKQVKTPTCTDKDIARNIGGISVQIINALLLSANTMVSRNLEKGEMKEAVIGFVDSMQMILNSFKAVHGDDQDQTSKLDDLVSSHWLECRSNAQAASLWLSTLKECEILHENLYDDNLYYLNKMLERDCKLMVNNILSYVRSTTFLDSQNRHEVLEAIMRHLGQLDMVCVCFEKLIQLEHAPDSLAEELKKIRNTLQKLNITESYSAHLKRLTNSGHQEVLKQMMSAIDDLSDSGDDTSIISQTMSFAASAVERSLRMPVIGNERQRCAAIGGMFTAFEDFRDDKFIKATVCRMEFLACKFALGCETPVIFMERSASDKALTLTLLSRMNVLHVLDGFLRIVSAKKVELLKQKKPMQCIKSTAHSLNIDTDSFSQILLDVDNLIEKNSEGHAAGDSEAGEIDFRALRRDIDTVRGEIDQTCKSFMNLKAAAEYKELLDMMQLFSKHFRWQLMHDWMQTYNSGSKNKDYLFNFLMGTSSESVQQESIRDIVALFGKVLASSTAQTSSLKIAFLEMVSDDELEKLLYGDQTHAHVLLVFIDGSSILFDRQSLLAFDYRDIPVYKLEVPCSGPEIHETIEKLEDMSWKRQMKLDVRDIKLELPDYPKELPLLGTALVVQKLLLETDMNNIAGMKIEEEDLAELLVQTQEAQHKLKDILQRSYKMEVSTVSLKTIMSGLQKVFEAVEHFQKEESDLAAFSSILSTIEDVNLSEFIVKVRNELKQHKDSIIDDNLAGKARLGQILERNQKTLNWMRVVDDLEEHLFDNRVRRFHTLSCLLDCCHKHINQMLQACLVSNTETSYEDACTASERLRDNFTAILQYISTDGSGIERSCLDFIVLLKSVTKDSAEMVKNLFFSTKDIDSLLDEYQFDVSQLNSYFIALPEAPLQGTSDSQERPLDPKLLKWKNQMMEWKNFLQDLGKDAKVQGFDLLQKQIVDQLARLQEMDLTTATEDNIHQMKIRVARLEEMLLQEKKASQEERKIQSCIDITGIMDAIEMHDIKDSDIEQTSPGIHCLTSKESKESLSCLMKKLDSMNSGTLQHTPDDFEKTLRCLWDLQNTGFALDITREMIANIPCPEESTLRLESLRGHLDDAESLLLANRLKVMLLKTEEEFDEEAVLKCLNELMNVLQGLRLKHFSELGKMGMRSVAALNQFVTISCKKYPVNVATLHQRMDDIKQAGFTLSKHMNRVASKGHSIQQDFFKIPDFLMSFTESKHDSCRILVNQCISTREFDKTSLKEGMRTLFQMEGEDILQREFIEHKSRLFPDTLDALVDAADIGHDHKSPAFILFSNLNFLHFFGRFWSDISNGLEEMNKFEVNKISQFVCGPLYQDYLSQKSTIQTENKAINDELTNLACHFEERKIAHERVLKELKSGKVTASHSLVQKLKENENKEKESLNKCTSQYEKDKNELEKKLKSGTDKLDALADEYHKNLRSHWKRFLQTVETYGQDVSDIFDRIATLVLDSIRYKRNTAPEQSQDEPTLMEQVRTKELYERVKKLYCSHDDDDLECIGDCCNRLDDLQGQVCQLTQKYVREWESFLGQGTRLAEVLSRCLLSGNSISTSIRSCVYNMQDVMQVEKEAGVIHEFSAIWEDVKLISAEVLPADASLHGASELTEEAMEQIMAYIEGISDLESRLHNDLYQSHVAYSRKFLARMMIFCICKSGKTSHHADTLLTYSEMPALPNNNAALTILLARLCDEAKSLGFDEHQLSSFSNLQSVSLYVLADQAKSLDDYLKHNTDSDTQVSNDMRKWATKGIDGLINVSVVMKYMIEHLTKLLKTFQGSSTNHLTKEEVHAFENLIDRVEHILDAGRNYSRRASHDTLYHLSSELCNISAKSESGQYGGCGLISCASQVMETMSKSRSHLKPWLNNLNLMSERVNFALSSILLSTEFLTRIKELDFSKDYICKYLIGRQQNQQFTSGAIIAQYGYHAVQEVMNLSMDAFRNNDLYGNVNIRFEKTILFAKNCIHKVCELLSMSPKDVEVMLLEGHSINELVGISEIEAGTKMMKAGAFTGGLSDICKKFDCYQDSIGRFDSCLNELKKRSIDWSDCMETLLAMRKGVLEDLKTNAATKYEAALKGCKERNVRREKDYEKDMNQRQMCIEGARQLQMSIPKNLAAYYFKATEEPSRISGRHEFDRLVLRMIESESYLLKNNIVEQPIMKDLFRKQPRMLQLSMRRIFIDRYSRKAMNFFYKKDGIMQYTGKLGITVKYNGKASPVQSSSFYNYHYIERGFHLERYQLNFCDFRLNLETGVSFVDIVIKMIPKDQKRNKETLFKTILNVEELQHGRFQKLRSESANGASKAYIDFEYDYDVAFVPLRDGMRRFCPETRVDHEDSVPGEFDHTEDKSAFDHFSASEKQLGKLEHCINVIKLPKPKQPKYETLPSPSDYRYSDPDDLKKFALNTLMTERLQSVVDDLQSTAADGERIGKEFQDYLGQLIDSAEKSLKDGVSELLIERGMKVASLVKSFASQVKITDRFHDELERQHLKFFKSAKCINEENDLIKYLWYGSRELASLHEGYLPAQRNAVQGALKTLHVCETRNSSVLRYLKTVSEMLSWVVLKLSQVMKSTLCSSVTDYMRAMEFVDHVSTTQGHQQEMKSIWNELKANESHLCQLNKLISGAAAIQPIQCKLSLKDVKRVRPKVARLDVEKTSRGTLVCSHSCVALDLGVLVKDIYRPKGIHLVLTSTNFTCDYALISLDEDINIGIKPCAVGKIVNGDFMNMTIQPDLEKLSPGLYSKSFHISLKDSENSKITTDVQLDVKFSIQVLDKFHLLPGLCEDRVNNCTVLDLQEVCSSSITKSFSVKNSLDIPLRLKFVHETNLSFDKAEIRLRPKEEKEQKFRLSMKPPYGEKEINVHIYYMADMFHELVIKYTLCKPKLCLYDEGKLISTSDQVQKSFQPISPARPLSCTDISLRNSGNVQLLLGKAEKVSNGVDFELPNSVLEPGEEMKLVIHVNPEGEGGYSGSAEITASAPDGTVCRTVSVRVTGKAEWPKLLISPEQMTFGVADVAKQVERELVLENVSAVTATLYGMSGGEEILNNSVEKFPLQIQPSSKERLLLKFAPPMKSSFEIQIAFDSDDKNGKVLHSITGKIGIPCFEIHPSVVDVGRLSRQHPIAQFSLTVQNSGSAAASITLKDHIKRPLKVKLQPKNFHIFPDESRKVEGTLTLDHSASGKEEPLKCKSFKGHIILLSEGMEDEKVPLIGQLDGPGEGDTEERTPAEKDDVPTMKQSSIKKIKLEDIKTTLEHLTDIEEEPLSTILTPFVNAASMRNNYDDVDKLTSVMKENKITEETTGYFFREYVHRRPMSNEIKVFLEPREHREACYRLATDLADEIARTFKNTDAFTALRLSAQEKTTSAALDQTLKLGQHILQQENAPKEAVDRFRSLHSAMKNGLNKPYPENLQKVSALASAMNSDFFGSEVIGNVGNVLDSILESKADGSPESKDVIPDLMRKHHLPSNEVIGGLMEYIEDVSDPSTSPSDAVSKYLKGQGIPFDPVKLKDSVEAFSTDGMFGKDVEYIRQTLQAFGDKVLKGEYDSVAIPDTYATAQELSNVLNCGSQFEEGKYITDMLQNIAETTISQKTHDLSGVMSVTRDIMRMTKVPEEVAQKFEMLEKLKEISERCLEEDSCDTLDTLETVSKVLDSSTSLDTVRDIKKKLDSVLESRSVVDTSTAFQFVRDALPEMPVEVSCNISEAISSFSQKMIEDGELRPQTMELTESVLKAVGCEQGLSDLSNMTDTLSEIVKKGLAHEKIDSADIVSSAKTLLGPKCSELTDAALKVSNTIMDSDRFDNEQLLDITSDLLDMMNAPPQLKTACEISQDVMEFLSVVQKNSKVNTDLCKDTAEKILALKKLPKDRKLATDLAELGIDCLAQGGLRRSGLDKVLRNLGMPEEANTILDIMDDVSNVANSGSAAAQGSLDANKMLYQMEDLMAKYGVPEEALKAVQVGQTLMSIKQDASAGLLQPDSVNQHVKALCDTLGAPEEVKVASKVAKEVADVVQDVYKHRKVDPDKLYDGVGRILDATGCPEEAVKATNIAKHVVKAGKKISKQDKVAASDVFSCVHDIMDELNATPEVKQIVKMTECVIDVGSKATKTRKPSVTAILEAGDKLMDIAGVPPEAKQAMNISKDVCGLIKDAKSRGKVDSDKLFDVADKIADLPGVPKEVKDVVRVNKQVYKLGKDVFEKKKVSGSAVMDATSEIVDIFNGPPELKKAVNYGKRGYKLAKDLAKKGKVNKSAAVSLLTDVMEDLGVPEEVTKAIETGMKVYETVKDIKRGVDTLKTANSASKVASGMVGIAGAAFSLIKMIPGVDIPEEVSFAIEMALGVAALLLASNPVTAALAAVGLALTALFGGLSLGMGGGSGSGGGGSGDGGSGGGGSGSGGGGSGGGGKGKGGTGSGGKGGAVGGTGGTGDGKGETGGGAGGTGTTSGDGGRSGGGKGEGGSGGGGKGETGGGKGGTGDGKGETGGGAGETRTTGDGGSSGGGKGLGESGGGGKGETGGGTGGTGDGKGETGGGAGETGTTGDGGGSGGGKGIGESGGGGKGETGGGTGGTSGGKGETGGGAEGTGKTGDGKGRTGETSDEKGKTRGTGVRKGETGGTGDEKAGTGTGAESILSEGNGKKPAASHSDGKAAVSDTGDKKAPDSSSTGDGKAAVGSTGDRKAPVSGTREGKAPAVSPDDGKATVRETGGEKAPDSSSTGDGKAAVGSTDDGKAPGSTSDEKVPVSGSGDRKPSVGGRSDAEVNKENQEMHKRIQTDLDKARSIADTMKKDCASMDTSSLDPNAVINITTNVSKSVSHLENTVDNIMQQSALGRSMDGLDPSTLNQVVDTGRFLHKMLGVARQVWKQRHVRGKLETTVEHLQKKLDGVLQTVVESLGENGDKLEKACLKDGIKLKTLKIADDYDVKFCKKEDVNPFHMSDKQRDMHAHFKEEFDIVGTLSVEGVPDTKREVPDNFAFVSEWPDASPFTTKPDSHGLKLETDRDYFAEIRKTTEIHREKEHDGPDDHKAAKTIPSKYIEIAVGDSKDVKSAATGRKVKVTLTEQQKKQMRKLCKQKLLSLGLVDEVGNTAKYKDPEELPFVEQDKLKYLLLARILKEHQSHAVNILTQFNDTAGKHAADLMEKQIFKFVFLVDNSGSMNGEKMTLALNILIVFLEAMKRLEYQTCVVRFGGEESQRILKTFQQDLDNQIGQFIIDAFDASEKTLAADAMAFVANEIFNTEISANEHRFVVLITDGIWSQQNKDAYGTYQNIAKARMIVLTTNPYKDEDLEFYNLSINRAKEILNNIAPGAWESIDPQDDLVDQIKKIADRLKKNICDELSAVIAESKKAASKQFKFSALKWAEPLTDLRGHVAGLKYKSNANIEWGKSIYTSDLYRDFGAEDMDEDLITDFTKRFEEVSNELDAHEVDTAENEVTTKCSMEITREEESLQTLITDLDTVLDTLILPNNRPTRPLQDYHGPTFSLKGFIRFICTDGQYKKIYENMIGHPRKDYQVSVILDTSASMAGMTAIGAIQGFIGLAAALDSCNVHFNLLTAGAETLIIKGFQQEWDALAKARAYNAIAFKDRSSNISDAILYTTQLIVSDSAAKAKKYIFVLTDGFDSTPGRLRTSLAYAESNDIMVTGLGIGYFTGGVFSNFPNYVVVNHPELLPDGLRKLFMAEGRNEMPPEQFVEKEKMVKTKKGKVMTNVDQIWNEEMEKVFSEQVERTKNALYLATNPIRSSCKSFGIDLCFVLDTTGSMGGFIEMAKKYIIDMTQKVRESVRKYSGKSTDLRVAFIGYKDFGDSGHTQEQPFTEHIDSVTALVSRMSPSGGGDTPEDKIRALTSALSYSWENRAKFLVLIADAPGHGTWCTGGKYRDHHPDKGGDMPGTVQRIAQKEIHLMYVQINNTTDYEFNNFCSTYNAAAPPSMKNGFIALDIRSGGGADKLQSMITDQIDDVIASEFM